VIYDCTNHNETELDELFFTPIIAKYKIFYLKSWKKNFLKMSQCAYRNTSLFMGFPGNLEAHTLKISGAGLPFFTSGSEEPVTT